eukprot:Skav207241  [mRNA]  locus=scaffold523:343669:363019:- [translate_table: standard]
MTNHQTKHNSARQAINTNDAKQLRKAISVSPRGKRHQPAAVGQGVVGDLPRAAELLNITVGTQSISPLYWAIESGSLNTAKAMLEALLGRPDGWEGRGLSCDQLFERHPEIIHKLNSDAPMLGAEVQRRRGMPWTLMDGGSMVEGRNLLRTLLDGLVWRSRLILLGQRRVNYYVKHLVQNADGGFNQALEWIVEGAAETSGTMGGWRGQDPKIICHDVVVLFADMLWCYFLFTLAVFITGQSILPQLHEDPSKQSDAERTAIFICRILIYVFSMGQLFVNQVRCLVYDCRNGHIVRLFKVIPFPEYLTSMMEVGNLALMLCLLILCTQDPIFHCINSEGPLFTQTCAGQPNVEVYSTLSMVAMLLYWALLLDLTIFSMQISAFTLVCGRVLSELGLFIGLSDGLLGVPYHHILKFHQCFEPQLPLGLSNATAPVATWGWPGGDCFTGSDFTNIPAGALSLMDARQRCKDGPMGPTPAVPLHVPAR